MEFIKKNKKYIIWAGCGIIALAVFLTFIKVSASGYKDSIKFTELTDHKNELKVISAYFVLIAAVVSAVLVYLNKEKFSLISTGAALVITFIDYFKINGRSVIKAYREYGSVHYVAPWVVLFGVIIAAAPIVIDILEEKGIIKKK